MRLGRAAGRTASALRHLLILDLEATCDQPKQICPQEIIEFPCVNLCTSSRSVVSQFHSYVRPDVHPVLTSFCTELTGIVQDMVDDQPGLRVVLEQFDAWLMDQRLPDGEWVFATFGDWDLQLMLPGQCSRLGITLPHYFRRWVNVKKMVYTATRQYPLNMTAAMALLNVQPQGRLHSGIDDVKNICRLVCELLNRGHQFHAI